MNNGYTYVIKCSSGRNKGNCPYILQNAITTCAACSAAVFVKRNREDYEWQKDVKTEENKEKQEENKEN